jgi:hypothetical protein
MSGSAWKRAAVAAAVAAIALGAWAPTARAGRFDQFTKQFEKTPDQAKVVAAGCLGGSGTEWLVGGGFQPDGTVVLAGVALGPTLEVAGTPAKVLGKDAPAPEAPTQPVVKDKKGGEKPGHFNWKHESATAFVALMSPDLRTVKSVVRLPWKAGGLTAATVDSEGGIYLAGPATDGLPAVGGDVKEEPVGDNQTKSAAVTHTYLAKLSPAGDRVLWVRHFKAPSNAPDVDIDKAGKVKFSGPDLRTYSRDGKLEKAVVIPGGLSGKTAVNPVDGTYARGGERHWPTGREPYRDPHLYIHRPDGKVMLELYNWDGPYIGLDNLRLESDSAVRIVRYDDDGNLVLYAWSDGGNSVMYREPFDVRTFAKEFKGLGFSAWGAGVLSCAYIVKLDTKTWRVTGGTLWLAFLQDKDKPNSINVDSLGFASDGSVCFAGGAAWGLIRTGNAIGGKEPGGSYVAVLNKECNSLRFSSDMPGCAKVDVNDGAKWGIIRGTVNGKPMALFVGSAVAEDDGYNKGAAPPKVEGPGKPYGGGLTDGYFLLLDLSK